MSEFRGDWNWVHEQEGHNGGAYWPKGKSGVTLDPGVDLGQVSPEKIKKLYAKILTEDQLKALDEVYGLKGPQAEKKLSGLKKLSKLPLAGAQLSALAEVFALHGSAAEQKLAEYQKQGAALVGVDLNGLEILDLQTTGPVKNVTDWQQRLQDLKRAGTQIAGIKVSKAQATEVFKVIGQDYWDSLVKKFPALADGDVPSVVHTALLSLGYNRGVGKSLNVLKEAIKKKDWKTLGNLIQGMQQDHPLENIRKRRRKEGALILDWIKANERQKPAQSSPGPARPGRGQDFKPLTRGTPGEAFATWTGFQGAFADHNGHGLAGRSHRCVSGRPPGPIGRRLS